MLVASHQEVFLCRTTAGKFESYLLFSFFKDSGWVFIWACSFFLV